MYGLVFPLMQTLVTALESGTNPLTGNLNSSFNFDELHKLIDLVALQVPTLPNLPRVPVAGTTSASGTVPLEDSINNLAASFTEPNQAISSGRKTVKRFKRRNEQARKAPCSLCGVKETKHDKRNCPAVLSLGIRVTTTTSEGIVKALFHRVPFLKMTLDVRTVISKKPSRILVGRVNGFLGRLKPFVADGAEYHGDWKTSFEQGGEESEFEPNQTVYHFTWWTMQLPGSASGSGVAHGDDIIEWFKKDPGVNKKNVPVLVITRSPATPSGTLGETHDGVEGEEDSSDEEGSTTPAPPTGSRDSAPGNEETSPPSSPGTSSYSRSPTRSPVKKRQRRPVNQEARHLEFQQPRTGV